MNEDMMFCIVLMILLSIMTLPIFAFMLCDFVDLIKQLLKYRRC